MEERLIITTRPRGLHKDMEQALRTEETNARIELPRQCVGWDRAGGPHRTRQEATGSGPGQSPLPTAPKRSA